jgi:hypothetical protein
MAVLSIGAAHAAEVDAKTITIFYIGPANAPAALGGIGISPGQTVTDVALKSIGSAPAPDLRCTEIYGSDGVIAVSCHALTPPVACETKVKIGEDGTGHVNSPACGPNGEQLAVKVGRAVLPPTEPEK